MAPAIATGQTDEVESLYHELLHLLYEADDREGAREPASRLERILESRQDLANSIHGEDIRSLIAEELLFRARH
jgi:hypothetical protein